MPAHSFKAIPFIAAMGLLFLSSAHAGAKMMPPPTNDACLDFIGYIELAEDKTIVVTYYHPVNATHRISPRERVYAKYHAMLDEDRPEEPKYLVKLEGKVSMAGDRSLRVEWERGSKDEVLPQPRIEILEPSAQGYRALIDRVQGLMPGESKVIPSRAAKCRETRAP